MDELREWYEPDGDPREALGRYARRLRGGGALYLGGGIGVEAVSRRVNNERVESYALVPGGEKFDGPLSAVTAAFTAAGKSTSVDTPGGPKTIAEASIAARLHELDASEREEKATIVRYTARAARRAAQGALSYVGGQSAISDDGWELRRVEEARANISAIAAERTRLMSGKLSESTVVKLRVASLPATIELGGAPRFPAVMAGEIAERGFVGGLREAEAGKPGTNWKQVSAPAKAKLGGILKHYKASAKPFTECVADNTKRFGEEGAKKVCAVVKDLNEKSTKWRKGGGVAKVAEELAGMVELAESRLELVDRTFGHGAVQKLLESELGPQSELGQLCEADVILLHLNGDVRATTLLERQLNARGALHGDDGRFMPKGRADDAAPKRPRSGEVTVRTAEPEQAAEPVAESGMIGALLEYSPTQHRDLQGRFARVLGAIRKAVRDELAGVRLPDEGAVVRISDSGDFIIERPGAEPVTAKLDTEAAKIVRAAGSHKLVKPKGSVRRVAVIGRPS